MSSTITGFQTWADFLKALVFVCGTVYATLTFALDSRYASKETIAGVVQELKKDRISSDIGVISRRVDILRMQTESLEDDKVKYRREQEIMILESDKRQLERDLEALE